MRWRGNRISNNIEDRRNISVAGLSPLGARRKQGISGLLPLAFRLFGFKGSAIIIILVGAYYLYAGNMASLLDELNKQLEPPTHILVEKAEATEVTQDIQETASEKELVDFISVILADTEDTWQALFAERGLTYTPPKLVLFRDAVQSACGMADSAVGPFYCPEDQQIYLDLSFYEALKNRYQASGDFAQAYVIAHEVAHHVQTLLGTTHKMQNAGQTLSDLESNKLSVLQELQADCFAGIWANHASTARNILETGDIEEGLTAASAVGDDTLQKLSQGYVSPDSFTHGSAAQRVEWFKTGLTQGTIDSCNTFDSPITASIAPITSSSTSEKTIPNTDKTLIATTSTSVNTNLTAPEAIAQDALPAQTETEAVATAMNSDNHDVLTAFKNRSNKVQIHGSGIISQLIADRDDGKNNQRFIVQISDSLSILISHKLDYAPRVANLKTGDSVEFEGEYKWNDAGGVVYWTHDSVGGSHPDGWVKHNGIVYQ